MNREVRIGGQPVARLQAPPDPARPTITSAVVAPGRGMMLLQARLTFPDGRELDLIEAPDLEQAAARLDGGPDDFAGNQSFAFGGAILLPYANRIRGRPLSGAREIETDIGGHPVRLPRNWGGKAPGAETYAMHGLLLDKGFTLETPAKPGTVHGRFDGGDFGGHWLSALGVDVSWSLEGGGLLLRVEAVNTGHEPAPVGIGWHPYFRLPSGRREQVRLSLLAQARLEVDNYDTVLPTGGVSPVDGPHDFRRPQPLGGLYMDDCFVDLHRQADGDFVTGFDDPQGGLAVRLRTPSQTVQAVQVYAPPDRSILVLEPQFNWPDPFGRQWSGADTGMVWTKPGEAVSYEVFVEAGAIA